MGAKALGFSSDPASSRTKFNFTGIKDFSASTNFSCCCSSSEPAAPKHLLSQVSLQSLARSYIARKQNLPYPPRSQTSFPNSSKPLSIHPSRSSSFHPSLNSSHTSYIESSASRPSTNRSASINTVGPGFPKDSSDDIPNKSAEHEVLYLSEKRKYHGDLKNGLPHGVGREEWPDGGVYEGLYALGNRTGHGKFVWPDGSWYKGSFLDNEMQGYGVYQWSNGNRYEGIWWKSQMHGEGKFIWSNGNYFIGGYSKGLKHGEGLFVWADGRLIKGRWFNGNIQPNI